MGYLHIFSELKLGGEDSEYDDEDSNVDSEGEHQSSSSSNEELGDHDRGNQEEDRGDQEEDREDQNEEIGNATTSSKKKKQLDAERKLCELKDEEFKHLSAKMQIQEQTLASKDEKSKHLSATVQEQGLQLQAIASFLASQGMTLPQFHTTNNKSKRQDSGNDSEGEGPRPLINPTRNQSRLRREAERESEMKQPMIPNPMMSSSFPPTNITTDQIQKFLDENKQLILAIMNNQNLGKLAECAQYQALLQKNLMYLAAIADAQPPTPTPAPTSTPTPTISSQMTPVPHPGMQQQGGFYMQQHPQAVMAQQPSGFPPQMAAMPFNSPQAIQAQMGGRSGGPMHGEATLRGVPGGLPTTSAPPSDVWRGGNSMQDGGGADGGAPGKDGHGGPGVGSAVSVSEEAK
ncbi:hypothetical protein L6452_36015 [Arctium lappa]|uniref:Uncharacterized protein n=1 Tax=Arctium lappa TaxID=4217 RepID=A0ACB8Y816_ARCLA|nr:hypothetical protein L6452_36015 [Arctium lappa]